MNTQTTPAEQQRSAIAANGVVVDYFDPVLPGQGAVKDAPVAALDQLFGYFDG